MKAVVGLGNPGDEYAGTRHNVGFDVIDRLCERHHVARQRDKRLGGRLGRGRIGSVEVLFFEPLAYMNRSGPPVARLLKERDIALSDLLVISDDFSLPLGKLRLRTQGSAGGHNGLRSLIADLGDDGFSRLRLGIGEPPYGLAERWVLSRFKPVEREPVDEMLDFATNCAEDWCSLGPERAMNRHN